MARRTRRGTPAPLRVRVGGGVAEIAVDPDRPGARTLFLDGTPQSHVDLDDPTHLTFEYQRRLGHIADLAAPPGRPLRALHLGAGGLTLARYIAATRPRSRQQAVEVDAELVALVRAELPLERGWQIRVRTGDARAVLAKAPDASADLVIADVFSEARTPAHLTTVEFLADVDRVLAPGGLYAANLADGSALTFSRAQVATVRAVFPEVCVIADPAVLRGRRFGNVVLLAAHHALPIPDLTRRTAADPFPGRVDDARELDRFTAGALPVTDTDAVDSPRPPDSVFTPR